MGLLDSLLQEISVMDSPMAPDMDREREMMMELQEAAMRKQDAMKMSMMKWKEERERNAEYIEEMRRAKEERKKEIEAQDALLLQMKEEAEAEAAKAEEEERKMEEMGKNPESSSTSAETKAEETKQNFADQKKFKSKDEREYFEALTKLIKPFDVKTMETEDLKKKVTELYDIFTNLINDKISLNKTLVEQDANIKILREKLNEILDARAAKKSGVDMHKFYPGMKSSHPPKMQIFSKYDNRKGTRSYDERKEMYDVGTDVVRPQMLINMWDQKFTAWLSEHDGEN